MARNPELPAELEEMLNDRLESRLRSGPCACGKQKRAKHVTVLDATRRYGVNFSANPRFAEYRIRTDTVCNLCDHVAEHFATCHISVDLVSGLQQRKGGA